MKKDLLLYKYSSELANIGQQKYVKCEQKSNIYKPSRI